MCAEKLNKKDIACLHGSYSSEDGKLDLFNLSEIPGKGTFSLGKDKIRVSNLFGEGVFSFEIGSDHTKAQFVHCDVKTASLDGNATSRKFEYNIVADADGKDHETIYNVILSGQWVVYGNHNINGDLYFECQDDDWLSHVTAFDEHGEKVEFN